MWSTASGKQVIFCTRQTILGNVKIVREENLISCGEFAGSKEWQTIREKIHKAIRAVEWPPGSGSFTIYPQSGKKRGEGNGVDPIKQGLKIDLKKQGWSIEEPAKLGGKSNPGDYDAMLETKFGPVVVEWETGNISSSHRSLNKMAPYNTARSRVDFYSQYEQHTVKTNVEHPVLFSQVSYHDFAVIRTRVIAPSLGVG